MKVSILGRGFGAYGYLPAASSLGWEVATLARYRESIQERPELEDYLQNIRFLESENQLIDFGSALIIARTPNLQFEFLSKNISNIKNISHIFLEKPLSSSTSHSRVAIDSLKANNKSFSVGYLFPYTVWFKDLESIFATSGNHIVINWNIPNSNSIWKNDNKVGGGIISFFMVHFVPVLIKLGFSISNSEISLRDGEFTLQVQNRNYIEINARIVTENFKFEIWANNNAMPLYQAQTPFGLKPTIGFPDPRISILGKYLSHVFFSPDILETSYNTELEVINFLNLC